MDRVVQKTDKKAGRRWRRYGDEKKADLWRRETDAEAAASAGGKRRKRARSANGSSEDGKKKKKKRARTANGADAETVVPGIDTEHQAWMRHEIRSAGFDAGVTEALFAVARDPMGTNFYAICDAEGYRHALAYKWAVGEALCLGHRMSLLEYLEKFAKASEDGEGAAALADAASSSDREDSVDLEDNDDDDDADSDDDDEEDEETRRRLLPLDERRARATEGIRALGFSPEIRERLMQRVHLPNSDTDAFLSEDFDPRPLLVCVWTHLMAGHEGLAEAPNLCGLEEFVRKFAPRPRDWERWNRKPPF